MNELTCDVHVVAHVPKLQNSGSIPQLHLSISMGMTKLPVSCLAGIQIGFETTGYCRVFLFLFFNCGHGKLLIGRLMLISGTSH